MVIVPGTCVVVGCKRAAAAEDRRLKWDAKEAEMLGPKAKRKSKRAKERLE